MKSYVVELNGPRQVVITEKEIPEQPPSDSVLARTLYSAISTGTELAAYQGLPPLRPGPVYPRLVGYCNVAEVIAVGSEVKDTQPGDRILTFQSHRTAFVCPAREIITSIPSSANLQAAATTYLYHLGYNALLKGELRPGYRVAVIGLGFIGLGTVALAQLFGARTWAFSNQESSLEISKGLGATACRKVEWARHQAEIAKATQGDGIDLVVITSNSWSDWRLALELARKGGVICVLGFPGRGETPPDFNPLDSQYFYDKQLSLIACGYTSDLMASPQDVRFTIRRNCSFLLDLILSSRLDPSALITEVRPWRDIEKVYASAASRKKRFFTCVLDWSEAV